MITDAKREDTAISVGEIYIEIDSIVNHTTSAQADIADGDKLGLVNLVADEFSSRIKNIVSGAPMKVITIALVFCLKWTT